MKYLEDFDQKFAKAVMMGIPTDRFWEFVSRFNWEEYVLRSWNRIYTRSESPLETENILKIAAPYYTFEEFKEFKKIYVNLFNVLDKRLRDVWLGDPGIEVSDDGYLDLRSSIIGFGKKYYKKILDDNSNRIVKKMAIDGKYAENFGYIFNVIDEPGIKDIWDKIYRSNNFDPEKKKEIINYVNSKELKRFWEFVEDVNWWVKAQFTDYGKEYVLKNFAPEYSHDEFKEFQKIYKKLDDYLKLRLEDLVLHAEGDMYWDLRSSIIGFGKNLYLNVIRGDKNNFTVKELDYNNDYYENFGYIFSNNEFDITVPEEDCKEEWDKIYNEYN